MSKSNKKVSITKLESAIRPDNIQIATLHGTEDVVFEVKRNISLEEMLNFVNEIVESCVDTEDMEYLPQAFDFSIRAGVLTYFANFTLPASLDRRYAVVYQTDAFEQTMEMIDKRQLNDIVGAAEKKIQFMLDVISSSAVGKVGEVIQKFNDIAESASAMLGDGLSSTDINNLMDRLERVQSLKATDVAGVVATVPKEE